MNSDYTIIELTQGQYTVIDEKHSDLKQYNWYAHRRENTFYAVRKTGGRKHSVMIYLHREILSRKLDRALLKTEQCDHIDGNGLNNAENNLRLVTPSQNIMNSRVFKNNKSGVKGVSWMENLGKWRAYIFLNGKQIYLGLFQSLNDAKQARMDAEIEYFREHKKQ